MMERKKKNPPSSKSKDECMKKEMDKIVVKSEVYHISDDLIREILLRLPPISVLRFKYVCKAWYSLITNPDFLRTHSSSLQFYKHSNDEELMVSSCLSKEISLKSQKKEHPLLKQVVFPSELLDCYLINSCNGLLLLREKSNSNSYYVCNPMIKHYFKIPYFNAFGLILPYILFDLSTSLSYKLIRYCIDENGDVSFSVYSSEIGSWRRLIDIPSEIMNYETAVLLNGIFYWKVHNGDHLICFDLKKENVWYLPLPPKPMVYSRRKCFYFGNCDGRLRLIEKYFDHSQLNMRRLTFPCSFDIMETEPQQQHNEDLTWSVKYHVNINTGYYHLIKNHPSTIRIVQLYKTKNEGEEEALLLNIHGKIVPFNLKSNTFGKVQNTRHSPVLSDFTNTFSYIATLFPLL